MAIPDFQSVMLPLLQLCSDGKEHTNREAIEVISNQFKLTPEERKKRLPSGLARVIDNRIGWARTHMKRAGLLDNVQRGVFRITDRGMELLKEQPSEINMKTLRRYPEYAEARDQQTKKKKDRSPPPISEDEGKTPEEQIEEAYETIRENLASDLLNQLKSASPAFFEKVVVEVLVKMGYGGSRKDAGEAIGGSGDEGIDGIIKEDRLGLDIIYIQAKKWEGTVSRPEIQKFVGALQGKRARKGVFITTSEFSDGARKYVGDIESKIILIDGQRLAQFMIDFDVGVASEAVFELKRLDSDYFEEG